MRAVRIPLVVALICGSVIQAAIGAARSGNEDQAVILVVGAAGLPQYAGQFAEWADLWERACGKANVRLITIGVGKGQTQSDRDMLQGALRDASSEANAALWLVLIGHGTYDGRTAKFNLRGPDVSGRDLAGWLEPLRRPLAVINTTASSAPFLKKISGPGRIVISATKSGFEQNFTRFGLHFAKAVADTEADLDKDGQTSLLEAFLSASHGVAEFYSAAGRLATEHALIDDNGDGRGTPADWFRGVRPLKNADDDASRDGYRAHQLHLLYSEAEARMPPDLRMRRDRLELEVMSLRDTRETLPEDEYFQRLESLLREIAQLYEQAEAQSRRR